MSILGFAIKFQTI